jgi:uncharacterized membrane protein
MGGRGRFREAGVLVVTVVVLVLAVACETPHDLGTFGGGTSAAADVNDAGVTVGWADTIDGGPRAFAAAPGGPLQGLTSLEPGSAQTRAVAINRQGEVVTTDGRSSAVWSPVGRPLDVPLPTFPGIDVAVVLADINDPGIAVGQLLLQQGRAHSPIVWDRTVPGLIALPEPEPNAYRGQAFAVDNAGRIVGQTSVAGAIVPVVWTPDGPGRWRDPEVMPLPRGMTYRTVTAINDHGMIVGSVVTTDGTSRAVVWQGPDHAVTEVPTPAGSAYGDGINDAGMVVGQMSSTGDRRDPRPAAFRWAPGDAKATELLGLGGTPSAATAINDAGVTVGYSTFRDRTGPRAVRWVDEAPPAAR